TISKKRIVHNLFTHAFVVAISPPSEVTVHVRSQQPAKIHKNRLPVGNNSIQVGLYCPISFI
ncbi:MAG: hypothetical protein Q4F76_00975, partial [Lachnospiraceae bacterium]|nr:hypothetical protein [Lachnospiraceae bacterium]